MCKVFVIFTLLLEILKINAMINPHGPTVVADITDCIRNIVESQFKDPGLLIFANHDDSITPVARIKAKLLTRLHEMTTFTVEVKTPQKEIDVCDNYDDSLGILHRDVYEAQPLGQYFIMISDNYEHFSPIMSRLIRTRSWNPAAKFIILLFNFDTEKANKKLVEKIFSCLFKFNVINVVIIVPHTKNVRKALIFSWQPYEPPKYCGYYNETASERVFLENTCEKGNLKNQSSSFFIDKIPRNMNGCILHIIALEREPFVSKDPKDSSIEKMLINEVLRRYKIKPSYTIVDLSRGEREDDGQWNGALKHLTAKDGQLLLGGIFPDFDVHEDFDCSLPYLADSYTWVVPRADQAHPWIALIIIFQKYVWYSVIAGFSICGLFWRILGQMSGDTRRNQSTRHCFLNSWICSLGFCAYIRPKKSSLRLFFVFFNIYCILVVTAYQTKLIDILNNPTYEYQIHNIEELVESGLKFGGFEELHDLFMNASDPFDRYIYDNWIDVTDISKALIDVTVHRNFSLLCSRLELEHVSSIVPDLSDNYGNLKYYAFRTNMFSVPMEMVALKGFGYMSRISEVLSLFKQAGISEAVREHFRSFNIRRRAKLLRTLLRERPDINSLSVQHLQGGFLVLALGYFTGMLVFSLEIVSSTDFVRRKLAQRNSASN